ncbi:MAG: DUF1385 domain-containing protein [Deltaproteobacteria bacterium]|nr:DUF1385 domain-containing protein [Deltaproteobacteria bacterium]
MERITVGGQAVLEGVMMRSPRALAVAVRKPNGEVAVKEDLWRSLAQRWKFLKWPLLRGSVVLVETLVNGLQALSFSASQAMGEEEKEKGRFSSWGLGLGIAAALGIAILLFVILPHLLTGELSRLLGREVGVELVSFHLLDGLIKVLFFLGYVCLISLLPDIRRVFQYHGAEHKCIHAYEAGEELTVGNARKHSVLHPRCGTAFLLIVLLISIGLFSLLFPLLPGFPSLGKTGNTLIQVGIKLPLLFPIAGLAYEVIRMGGKRPNHPGLRLVLAPGLWLQRLTTRPPQDEQIEIALRALQGALRLETGEKTVL